MIVRVLQLWSRAHTCFRGMSWLEYPRAQIGHRSIANIGCESALLLLNGTVCLTLPVPEKPQTVSWINLRVHRWKGIHSDYGRFITLCRWLDMIISAMRVDAARMGCRTRRGR
jgi:hypothetical protein